jgi:DNA repair photolyase
MKRWGEQKPIHLDERELKTDLGKGKVIFIGSSCDMFADDIEDKDILRVLDKVREHQENRYLFQTRNLIRIKNFMFPIDTIIGTTIETNRYRLADHYSAAPSVLYRIEEMKECLIKRKIVTIEPIMDFDVAPFVNIIETIKPIQVHIGADSGNNGLPEPSKEKIAALIDALSPITRVLLKKT